MSQWEDDYGDETFRSEPPTEKDRERADRGLQFGVVVGKLRKAEAERDRLKAEVERLTADNAELARLMENQTTKALQAVGHWQRAEARAQQAEKDLAFHHDALVRVAAALGISEPLQLIVLAENNEETYVDLLIKHIRALQPERREENQ